MPALTRYPGPWPRPGVWLAIVLAGLLSLPCPAPLQAAEITALPRRSAPERPDAATSKRLDKIVLSRLAFYAAHYPDIDFVVLDSAGGVPRNMAALERIIGKEADPLDYEHPADLRHQLLYVTLMRIEFLLGTDVGSATLFRPGEGALAKRKAVCVVTIDPEAIARSDRAATLHLLDLTKAEADTIPADHYLGHVDHLKFALDHEIYHCLDSRYNGPMPMSHREHWSDYMMLKDEAGADAFGAIMNIADHGAITPYARGLRTVRGLALLGGDPNHYTYATLGAVLKLDPAALAGDDVRRRFKLATTLRDRIVGNYDDYLRYAGAAMIAMRRLGVTTTGKPVIDRGESTQALAKTLVDDTRACYRTLTGRPLPTAKKPHPPQ